MTDDNEQKNEKPDLRIVVDNTATGRIETGEIADSAKRLLGEVGRQATSSALEELYAKTPAEHGDELLETYKELLQLTASYKGTDETTEKIQSLFFLFAHLAFSQGGNLARYVIGDGEHDHGKSDEDLLEGLKREFARRYDALIFFEDELNPARAARAQDMPGRYQSEVWADKGATRLVTEGFQLIRVIVSKDLPEIYHESPEWIIREIKASFLVHGMGIVLPGKHADEVAITRYKKEVKDLVNEAWAGWRREVT